MILKASQRGGAKQLGLHLLRQDDNEHVEVHEVRGFVSEDVVGALKEAHAVSQGTRCKQFLFSVSFNPPETEQVGTETFEQAIDRVEAKTGLAGQPRVIVFHEKDGRRHAHAVWSRIDAERMTAVNLPHFKLKLRDISRELYLEHDWKMPRGLMNSEARDPRNFSLAEWQQAKRMGKNARHVKAMMQECWAVSDSRAAFEQALSERGFILAKGDRRVHVAVTHEGEVLSVARSICKRTTDVRAKLGAPSGLPSVDDARAQMGKDMTQAFNRHVREARDQHNQQREKLERQRQTMTAQHRSERLKLDAGQKARWEAENRARSERLNKGLRGLWDRLTGRHAKIIADNQREADAALQRDREQRDALVQAQLQDRLVLQAQTRAARQQQAELLYELRKERSQRMTESAECCPNARPGIVASNSSERGTDRSTKKRVTAKDSFARVAELRKSGMRHSKVKSSLAHSAESAETARQDYLARLRDKSTGNKETGLNKPSLER